jgi:hypothetical protein
MTIESLWEAAPGTDAYLGVIACGTVIAEHDPEDSRSVASPAGGACPGICTDGGKEDDGDDESECEMIV